MRILYVNWAPLWRGAEAGGGVNGYARAMARSLVERGHEVHAVNAGYSYDLLGLPRIRRAIPDRGVFCHEIVNSPVLAPGYFNFSDPLQEISEPRIERLFGRLLDRLRPDVVHFHNIEGFSGRCIALAKQRGARIIYSLHNYHPLCNQVNLLYQNRTPCTDFDHGRRCLGCLPSPPPRWRHRLRRRMLYYLRGLPGIQRLRPRARQPAPHSPPDTLASPIGPTRAAHYAERRKRLVDCLNQADRLLAVSSRVREIYVAHGLDPRRVTVNTIGSAIAEHGLELAERPSRPVSAPLRLVFLGVAEPHKGLPLLLETLTGMTDTELSRIDLALYARGVHALDEQLASLRQRLADLRVSDGYRYESIPELLADRDLGVVAPIWWDNAPQVVFELLALGVPVLGARIGGIPDFVADDVNGLLFTPGDPAALAAKLRRTLTEPGLIQRLRAGIRPMKTLAEHADELEAFYAGRGD
jgi:glycosyltransferase involved in cell wall biosynthesis